MPGKTYRPHPVPVDDAPGTHGRDQGHDLAPGGQSPGKYRLRDFDRAFRPARVLPAPHKDFSIPLRLPDVIGNLEGAADVGQPVKASPERVKGRDLGVGVGPLREDETQARLVRIGRQHFPQRRVAHSKRDRSVELRGDLAAHEPLLAPVHRRAAFDIPGEDKGVPAVHGIAHSERDEPGNGLFAHHLKHGPPRRGKLQPHILINEGQITGGGGKAFSDLHGYLP